MKPQHKLEIELDRLNDRASQHKKAVKYHRRRLGEFKAQAAALEKQLAEYGIEVQIHSHGGNTNGKGSS